MVQTTLAGETQKTIIREACEKRENGHLCRGDLIEIGKNQFRCVRCRKITVIEVLR